MILPYYFLLTYTCIANVVWIQNIENPCFLACCSSFISIFISKSNKHNYGIIYIQFFTLYRTAVNVILRLLFFVCKDSWKENFQELSPLPTDYGYSYVAAFSKLFGTFLLWYPIQKCGFCHIDEHVHILSVLFSVQFGIDNVAWSFLHY